MKKEHKNLIILSLILLLFYISPLFSLIPIYLFNINLKTCGDLLYNFLRIFPNIMLAIIMIIIYRKDLKKEGKSFKKNFYEYGTIAIRYWLLGFIGMAISNYIISFLIPNTIAANEEGIREIISYIPFISIIAIGIFSPIGEELIFRKTFKNVFNNKWLFILISGLSFGSLHVVSSLTSFYDFLYIVPYSSLGIAFAAMYYKTNNICTSIFAHTFHNLTLILLNIFFAGVILL